VTTGYIVPSKEEKGEMVMELAKEPEDKLKRKKVKKVKKPKESNAST